MQTWQQFQRNEQRQAIVLTIIFINLIQQRFMTGCSVNTATAANPVRWLFLRIENTQYPVPGFEPYKLLLYNDLSIVIQKVKIDLN